MKLPGEPNRHNTKFKFNVFADTGAGCSLISADLAKKHNITADGHVKKTYKAVNGDRITTQDSVDVIVAHNNKECITKLVITPDLDNDIIIGLKDLKKLKVVHSRFPLPIFSATADPSEKAEMFEDIKNNLIQKFPKVLADTLPQPMSGGKMHVNVKAGTTPYKVVTSRRIPLRYEKKAKNCIAEMIDDKIIMRETGHTPWCAPGFFVGKPNGEVRPVIDYTKLNKHIARDAHMFPSAKDIVAGISPKSRYFATLHLKSGYHQVELDEESSKLTTFLLFNGRYRYLRAPMGLCSSSDEFCRRTDEALADLPIRKLVDDILITAETMEELKSKCTELLQRCDQHNIALSKNKFKMGERVTFAGFNIDANGVTPLETRLQAIEEFPTPKNITDVRSFLGIINQLSAFTLEIAGITDPLRALL